MAKRKRTNSDIQNTPQETKDRPTRTHIKRGGVFRCSGRVSNSCSTSDTRQVTIKRQQHHLIWKSCWTTVYVMRFETKKKYIISFSIVTYIETKYPYKLPDLVGDI
jgi:hypothetical protein